MPYSVSTTNYKYLFLCVCTITDLKTKKEQSDFRKIFNEKKNVNSITKQLSIKMNKSTKIGRLMINFEDNKKDKKNPYLMITRLLFDFKKSVKANKNDNGDEPFNKIIEKLKTRDCLGKLCFEIAYNKDRYKSLLGLPLSSNTSIVTPKVLNDEMGKTTISGMKMSFENSSIGVEEIMSDVDEDNLNLKVKSIYDRSTYRNKNSLDYLFKRSIELATLFVDKKDS